MKVVCVVPPIHFSVNEIGHGYHPPLGLLTVAGPLVDAGFSVELLDADASHLSLQDIVTRLRDVGADIVLVGHSGSMPANPVALTLLAAIKAALPRVVTVYGGVYPTYACRELMRGEPALDFVVCGEGEVTTRELLTALQDGKRDLGMVAGLAWRSNDEIVLNRSRQPIQDLDQFRTAWELADWSVYRNNHISGRSAVVGFSRGCPHTCTYCGQWVFWKRWRYRSSNGSWMSCNVSVSNTMCAWPGLPMRTGDAIGNCFSPCLRPLSLATWAYSSCAPCELTT